jgi:hypothetical protein
MGNKPSDSPAHPYEPEPYPILKALREFCWMSEEERAALEEARARQYGGSGVRPRKDAEQEYER